MVRNAPPRKRSHFMQIHHASVTLTHFVSISCQRPSARSFCPGTPRRYFSYFRCLPGNGKRIWNGSVTRLQKCGISGALNLLDDLPLLRPAHMAYVDGMNVDVVWCIISMTDPSVCVIAHRAMSCRPRHCVVAISHDDVMTCDSPWPTTRPRPPPPLSCSDHVCVMHAPDHVHTKRDQGSASPSRLGLRRTE